MTKSELLMLLEPFDDNTPIVLALERNGCWVPAETVYETQAAKRDRSGLEDVALICGD